MKKQFGCLLYFRGSDKIHIHTGKVGDITGEVDPNPISHVYILSESSAALRYSVMSLALSLNSWFEDPANKVDADDDIEVHVLQNGKRVLYVQPRALVTARTEGALLEP